MGKSALLAYLDEQASGGRVLSGAGVQSEMELAFAGLHQLLGTGLDRVDRLPVPRCEALRTAFGVSAGSPPERFLVALAVLTWLDKTPALCPDFTPTSSSWLNIVERFFGKLTDKALRRGIFNRPPS